MLSAMIKYATPHDAGLAYKDAAHPLLYFSTGRTARRYSAKLSSLNIEYRAVRGAFNFVPVAHTAEN